MFGGKGILYATFKQKQMSFNPPPLSSSTKTNQRKHTMCPLLMDKVLTNYGISINKTQCRVSGT